MLNQVSLIGKVYKVDKNAVGEWYLILEVERSFKDFEGKFIKDYLTCGIWKGASDTYLSYYKEGQLVNVVGRLACEMGGNISIVAYQVDFLK